MTDIDLNTTWPTPPADHYKIAQEAKFTWEVKVYLGWDVYYTLARTENGAHRKGRRMIARRRADDARRERTTQVVTP